MTPKNSYRLITVLLMLLPVFGQASAAAQAPVNIAINKPYKFHAPPNYPHCTDPADDKDLTDGIHAKGYFWVQKATVGWRTRGQRISITVDLGSDQPISGVSFNTAGGAAGVDFLETVLISVSTNGEDFYLVGDLVELSKTKPPANNAYAVVKYSTQSLRTHGRYVQFTPLTEGMFVFVDEIEVYRGNDKWLNEPYNADDRIDFDNLLFSQRCMKRLTRHIDTLVLKARSARIADHDKTEILRMLNRIRHDARTYRPQAPDKEFRLIMPFDQRQREVIAVHATLLRAMGFAPLTIWHKDRYAPLAVFETPVKHPVQLNLRMMRNEYRAQTLNLTNATDNEIPVSFRLENADGIVDVRQVEYVDTRELQVAATALTRVEKRDDVYSTSVPAGMTRQIWFTIHSRNLNPGVHACAVNVISPNGQASIPFVIRVEDINFPDKPRLKTGVWDYAINYGYNISPQNRAYALRDMQEHFVNVAFGNSTLMGVPPVSGFDAQGRLTQPPDFTKFDEWLELWPDAGVYHVFCNIKDKNTTFGGMKPDDKRFVTAVSSWAAAWDEHVRNKGLQPGQVQMHFVDEPQTPGAYEVLGKWADAFKAGSRYIHVFNTPEYLDKDDNLQHALPALKNVDVICPTLKRYRTYGKDIIGAIDSLRKDGRELWLYMCYGPSRHYDPSYYRLQPWYCFHFGATGSGFWSYGDQRCANPWNEYDAYGGHSFALVYLTRDEITPTKHWEALREGVEDYEYLLMLRDKVRQFAADGNRSAIAARAAALLKKCSTDVIREVSRATGNRSDIPWMADSPCSYAESARLEILEMLSTIASEGL